VVPATAVGEVGAIGLLNFFRNTFNVNNSQAAYLDANNDGDVVDPYYNPNLSGETFDYRIGE
jgi:hypothetical protein